MNENELKRYIEMYHTMLYKIAYSITLDYYDSEDIVQETFIKLYHSDKTINEDSVKAWLIRVTVNLSKNRNKLAFIRKRADLSDCIHHENLSYESISDEVIDLKEALNQLPQKYRIVIHLHYYEGYQASEIAKILKISTTAVTTRLQRGRSQLKEYLVDEVKQ